MKKIILVFMVKIFAKKAGRKPTFKEIEELNENADIYARDLKRILNMEVTEYLANQDKINQENKG